MYGKGNGVKHNVKKAVKLFYDSSSQGNADTQYYLGLAYANGFGLKESLVKAYMWFNISAKINNNAKIAIKSLEKMMDQKERSQRS